MKWTYERAPETPQGYAIYEGILLIGIIGECTARPEQAEELAKLICDAVNEYTKDADSARTDYQRGYDEGGADQLRQIKNGMIERLRR